MSPLQQGNGDGDDELDRIAKLAAGKKPTAPTSAAAAGEDDDLDALAKLAKSSPPAPVAVRPEWDPTKQQSPFSGSAAGMVSPGNIDLKNRPRVKNPDGSISTVRSISVGIDGHEVLIPTVSDDGRILSDADAIAEYKKSGKHLGVFNDTTSANAYAKTLHDDQAAGLVENHGASGSWGDEGPLGKLRAAIRGSGNAARKTQQDQEAFMREHGGPDLTEQLGTIASDKTHNPIVRGAAMAGGMVTGLLEHPIKSGDMLLNAPLESADVVTRYAYQRAAEQMGVLDKWALINPGEPVTGEQAAYASAQLAAMGIAGPMEAAIAKRLSLAITARAARGLPTAGMGLGAAIVSHAAPGALVGASYAPEDPLAGAVAGATLGGFTAAASGARVRAPAPPTVEGANLADHPEKLLGERVSRKPATATGKVTTPEPVVNDSPFSVEMNTPGQALEETLAQRGTSAGTQLIDEIKNRRAADKEAHTDALTGLGNARAFEKARARAEADPNTSVVRFDLNGFKAVNDNVGHEAGDAALKSVAEAMTKHLPPGRAVFRVGGDEFAAIVPKDQAEAVRDAIEKEVGVRDLEGKAKYSISGGVGATNAEADANAIARKAEHKKAQGINGRAETPASTGPGVRREAIANIDVEPERFQYKLNTNEKGVTRDLADVKKYNPDLAGVVGVWRDPADGRLKVINGHHRDELARRAGETHYDIREIEAPNAATARTIGAMINIGEGKGTPIDAAKLFRESKTTPEDLEKRGIALKGSIARDGMAIAKLHPTLFADVVSGKLPVQRAAVIGGSGLSEEQQLALHQMLEQREASGKRLSNDAVAELVRFVNGAGETQTTQDSLFGEETMTSSLALEKAELSAHVKERLSKDRRVMGFISKGDRAAQIEGAGVGKIKVDKAADLATRAAQSEELYNKLSMMSGPVSDALNDAAREWAKGGNRDAIRTALYDRVIDALSAEGRGAPAQRGGEGRDRGGSEEGPAGSGAPKPGPQPVAPSDGAAPSLLDQVKAEVAAPKGFQAPPRENTIDEKGQPIGAVPKGKKSAEIPHPSTKGLAPTSPLAQVKAALEQGGEAPAVDYDRVKTDRDYTITELARAYKTMDDVDAQRGKLKGKAYAKANDRYNDAQSTASKIRSEFDDAHGELAALEAQQAAKRAIGKELFEREAKDLERLRHRATLTEGATADAATIAEMDQHSTDQLRNLDWELSHTGGREHGAQLLAIDHILKQRYANHHGENDPDWWKRRDYGSVENHDRHVREREARDRQEYAEDVAKHGAHAVRKPVVMQETVDDALHSILRPDGWDKLRERGLTDEELKQVLGRTLGISGSSSYDGWHVEYHGGSNPHVEIENESKNLSGKFKGKTLIDAARRLLKIPQYDGEEAKPAKPDKAFIVPTRGPDGNVEYRVEPQKSEDVDAIAFHSGASRATEIRGLADAGKPVGVSAAELSDDAIAELEKLAGTGIPVFLDSGAFSEFGGKAPITPDEWKRRLAIAQRLADALGDQLYFVAPDKVGDQEATLERLKTYADEVLAIAKAKAHVLVPVQLGAMKPSDFFLEVMQSVEGYIPIPALPMNKAAMSIDDVAAFVKTLKPRAVHLLGIGAKSPKLPEILKALRAIRPDIQVTHDSNALRSVTGNTGGKGGGARPLTQHQRDIEAEGHEDITGETRGEFGEHEDYTDEIANPSTWLSKKKLGDVARAAGLSENERAHFLDDPDLYLQQPWHDGQRYEEPAIAAALDEAWKAHLDHVLRPTRRYEAVRRTFGAHSPEGQRAENLHREIRDLTDAIDTHRISPTSKYARDIGATDRTRKVLVQRPPTVIELTDDDVTRLADRRGSLERELAKLDRSAGMQPKRDVDVQEGSRYEDEDQPAELLEASQGEAQSIWDTHTQAKELLEDTRSQTPKTEVAKKRREKLIEDLESMVTRSLRDFDDKLSEIEQAFGDDVAQKVDRDVSGRTPAPKNTAKVEGHKITAGDDLDQLEQLAKPKKPVTPQVAPIAGMTPLGASDAPVVQHTLDEEGTGASEAEVQLLMRQAKKAIQEKQLPKGSAELRQWVEGIIGRKYLTRTWKMDDVYDAIEGAANEIARSELGEAMAGDPLSLRRAKEIEEDIFGRRLRSSGQIARQQFSTPIPIARAAQIIAGVRRHDVVLEPTGGTGNLVNFLRDASVTLKVNEIEPRRVAILKALGLEPTAIDALRLPLTGVRANVVITNPPYGSASTGKYSGFEATPFVSNDIAQRFVAATMHALGDGDRLVAIMPANTLSLASIQFRNWLANHHTPVAYIESPPGAYETRGASIGTVLMVVDKGKASKGPEKPLIVGSSDWDTWAEAVRKVASTPPYARSVRNAPAVDVAPTHVERNESVGPRKQAELIDRAGTPSEIAQHGTPGEPNDRTGRELAAGSRPTSGESGRAAPIGGVQPERRAPGSGSGDESGVGRNPELVAVDGSSHGAEGPAGETSPLVPDVPRGRVEPRASDSPERRREIEAANNSDVFAPYALGNLERRSPHPRLVVETRAMAGLPAPAITAKVSSPLVDRAWGRSGAKGGISDEQMDAVLRGLSAWDKGHGFLAADDVGVGKTREAAALALEAIHRGETRILYTTKNENNVADAMAEFKLVASGAEDGKFPAQFVFVGDYKNVKAGTESLPTPPGPVIYFAHSYNFAAYAEALAEVKPTTWIADEAHEYKNLFASRGMAWRMLSESLLKRNGKFAYFTATPAVTLDELGYLYGLKEWAPGGFGDWVDRKLGRAKLGKEKDQAAADVDEEAAAANADVVNMGDRSEDVANLKDDDKRILKGEKKGKFMRGKPDVFSNKVTPAETEQVMRELKGSGKYIARDLWRGGVKFDVQTVPLLGNTHEAVAARARYDEAAELSRDISMAGRKFGRLNKKIKTAGLDRAMIQSYLKQLLFGLRLPTVLEHAKAALAAGQQVVISLHSVAGDADIEEGLSESDADTPVNERLRSAINRINVQHIEKHGDGAEAVYEDLGEIPEALMVRADLMDRLQKMKPLIDPVRAIEEAFGAKNVAVITGKRSAKQRKASMGEFQSGARKVAVISKAGKVGISLHDVNGKQRRMLVADYEWSADTFKQELGRVDRTGQKSSPHVSLVASDLAGERKFAATIAARMSSLGATSKGSAESTGTDALDQFDVSDGVSLTAMMRTVEQLDPDTRSYFTGSNFVELKKVGRDQWEFVPKKLPDGAGMKDFLLEMMMFPVDISNHVWDDWASMREVLRTGEETEKLAARRTGRAKGEVYRKTLLTAPGDPALTLVELKNAAGEKRGVLQGFVTPYIREIQEARGTNEFGMTKSRKYVHVTTPTGELVSGLDISPSEARSVKAMFGKNDRKTVTPAEAWEDLQNGDNVAIAGPSGAKWVLHPRRDGRMQIMGATVNSHAKILNGIAKYETVGNYLYVSGDEASVTKFLDRYPPAVAEPAVKPRGGKMQENDAEYSTERPRYYSRLERAIDAAPFDKGTAEQWAAALSKNVNKSEREWTGLDAYLERNAGKVLTRGEVRDVFESGKIDVGEFVATDTVSEGAMADRYRDMAEEIRQARQEFQLQMKRMGLSDGAVADLFNRVLTGDTQKEALAFMRTRTAKDWTDADIERFRELREDLLAKNSKGLTLGNRLEELRPKFEEYSLPGGDNYREIKIQLQDRPAVAAAKAELHEAQEEVDRLKLQIKDEASEEPWREARYQFRLAAQKYNDALGRSYMGPHFNEPNIIGHVRVKDRHIGEGMPQEKVLFVEELQSDWHQEGRELGYGDNRLDPEQRERKQTLMDRMHFGRLSEPELHELDQLMAIDKKRKGRVPDAPFKKTEEWVGLLLRRVIDEAVKGNYDRIAWTTGAQQVERYDLSKHVDEIVYDPTSHGFLAHRKGREVHHGNYPPEKLPGVIGKEAAKRLLAAPLEKTRFENPTHILRGKELKVGGHGIKAFYDEVMPSILRDYAKKLGIELPVDRISINVDDGRGGGPIVVYNADAMDDAMGGANDAAIAARFRTNGEAVDFLEGMSERQREEGDWQIGEDPHWEENSAPVQSITIPTQLREKVKREGQFMMEPRQSYNATRAQTDLFDVVDNGKPRGKVSALPKERDVAHTPKQRAAMERVLERAVKLGLQPSAERRRQLEASAKVPLLDPVGLPMTNSRQSAIVMTAFRHPAMEILHAFIKDDSGKVLAHVMRTSGELNWAAVPTGWGEEIAQLAYKVGGTHVELGHNHPSGDPTPSPDSDVPMTHELQKELEGKGLTFDGHVIINHGRATHFTLNGERSEVRIEHFPIPKMPTKYTVGSSMPQITAPADAVKYLAAATHPDAITVAFLDARNHILAIRPYVTAAASNISTWLPRDLVAHSARRVIIAVPARLAHATATTIGAAQQRNNPALMSHDPGAAWSKPILDVLGVEHNAQGEPGHVVSYAEREIVTENRERHFGGTDNAGDRTIKLAPGESASSQVARARASGRGMAAAENSGGIRYPGGVGEEDLFGNLALPEGEKPQTSLFGGNEGSAETRSLQQTEKASRSELEKLRLQEKGASPLERIKIAKRIVELEKLLNRGKAIGAKEMALRAVADTEENAKPKPKDPDTTGSLFEPDMPSYNPATKRYDDVANPIPLPEAGGLEGDRPKFRPRETWEKVRAVFNPESLGPEAKSTAATIRHETAVRFRAYSQAVAALRDLKKHIEKQSRERQVQLWDSYENDRPTGDPFVDAANKVFADVTEQRTKELIRLDKLKAESAIANYIGRFWRDTNKAKSGKVESFLKALWAKRPLEGPKSFLKHRSIESFAEGLQANLKPATYNYVESQLAKIAEMERLIGAMHMLETENALGRAKRVMLGRKPPVDADGRPWVQIDREGNDPAFTVYGPRRGMVKLPDDVAFTFQNGGGTGSAQLEPFGADDVDVLGHRIIGRWYAPRASAAVWQNHLSKGMKGNPIYDAATAPGQAVTSILLGVSGFHGTVIATEGMFSEMVMAMEEGANANAGAATRALGRAVTAPVSGVSFGRKVMAEYRKPGTHPELARVIEAMIAGGFRGQEKSELWSGERSEKLKKAFRKAVHGDTKLEQAMNAAALPIDAVYAGLEKISAPLMSKYVPLMKTAATYRAAAQRLSELPPSVPMDRLEREMWDVVKEMDLRFGQVMYDNYFINNFAKHLAQAMFMAPGWTWGTVTLMGRGTRDVAMVPKRLYDRARGRGKEQPILGRAGKYWVAAVVGTMIINALLTYWSTGEQPGSGEDGWKDFFAFRDGTEDLNGNANRHTIPGYLMHDVYGWSHHPVKTFLNKLSPFFAFGARLVQNRTYYGDMIYDEDKRLPAQLVEIGKEAGKEMGTPLSVQNYLEGRKRDQSGVAEFGRNAIGVTPAKREFVRTDAQNYMAKIASRKGHTAATPDEAAARDDRKDALQKLREGNPDAIDAITRAIEHGELTTPQLGRMMKRAGLIPLQESFKALTLEQALEAFNRGKVREQMVFLDELNKKAERAGKPR